VIIAISDLDSPVDGGEPVRISHWYRLSFNGLVRSAHLAIGEKAAEIQKLQSTPKTPCKPTRNTTSFFFLFFFSQAKINEYMDQCSGFEL